MFSMKHKSVKGLVVFLLIAFSANLANAAAISFDNASSKFDSNDNATISWSHTIGSGSSRMLIVGLGVEDTGLTDIIVNSVKYNGVNMDFVAGSSITVGSPKEKSDLYYMTEPNLPSAGTYTITVTYAGNVANKNAGAVSLTGVAQQAREAVSAGYNTDQNTISTSITTLTDGAWVISNIVSGNAGSFTATGTSMTERWDVSASTSSAASSTRPVTTAGQVTLSWQHSTAASGNRMAQSVAVFAPLPNQPPTVNAGTDQHITWPVNSVQLNATVSDDGFPNPPAAVSKTWSKVSGPGTVSFQPNANAEDPIASFSAYGNYTLRIEASDSQLSASDEVVVYVTAPTVIIGDLNHDGIVDLLDLDLFADQWLAPSGCPGSGCADFDASGNVDFIDYAFLASNWRLSLTPGRPVINEFMAANGTTIPDEQGQFDDWIEIYNAGDLAVDIGGYYITDDLNKPGKWQIPTGFSGQTTIPSHGYLLLWADDDEQDGPLHLKFKLSADGEAVGLYTSSKTLVDSIEFAAQTSDVSYGRYPDATENWQYMGIPTPGAQNRDGYLGLIENDVEISHSHGFYDSNFTVELFCEESGATIKYTLDGNTPTDTVGLTYNPSVRIPITGTTCLRAAAFKTGYKPSPVNTATYIFLNNIRNQNNSYAYSKGFPAAWAEGYADYEMDPCVLNDANYSGRFETAMKAIPTISLVTDINNLFNTQNGTYAHPTQNLEKPASIEYFDPCTGDDFQVNAGLAVVGSQSSGPAYTSKHSMRIYFKSEYGPTELDFPAFYQGIGATKLNNISLRTDYHYSWQDWTHQAAVPMASYQRDMFAQDTLRDMGWISPYSRSVHVYINGLYWGLYQASERPDAAFLGEHLNADWDNCDSIEGIYDGTAKVEAKDGLIDGWNYMYSLINGFSFNTPVTAAKYAEFEQHVDTTQMCDYMIYNTFVASWDWSSKNWYAGSQRDPCDINGPPIDKWNFYTWDSESAIDSPYTGISIPFNGYSAGPPGLMHNAVQKNPVYTRLLGDRVNKHLLNGGALTQQANTARWEKRAEVIENAIVAESARWGDFLRDTLGMSQYTLYTPAYWDYERDRMINPSHTDAYFPNRTNYMITSKYQYDGFYPTVSSPAFSQFGGEIAAGLTVTITGGGTIYYTTNGLEPDGNGTIIASGGTVTINNSLTLKARAYYGTSGWSALTEANFSVGPVKDKLRITELMYHPAEPGDPCQEFVELKNIGTTTLNLNLVKFTEGIHFTFPNTTLAAGGYILVVADISAFNAKYGSGKNIAGQYTSNLSNAGEHIRLEDAISRTIIDFNYVDSWQDSTDGEGFSLNILDANTDANNWNKQESWAASKYAGGTPCANDSALLKEHSIAINEILAHSDASPGDWIELKNTTSASIDISNWYLSDNVDNLTKYRIKAGTVLAPGAYLVLSSDANFGPLSSDTGKITSFGFSEYGETAYITSSDGTVLTGYREKEDFGPSENGVAFGRYQKSTGTYNFVPMSSNTPGAANAYPKVGPVVINEIMYNPPDLNGQNSEYIELLNTTGSTVNLYDVNGVPWKFSDGIDYVFPASTTIPANGYLLVVKTTPAYFRTKYTVPTGITVLGPYSGNLSNAGETLELVRPTDTDESGQPVYTRVDRVVYSDGSHPADCPEGNDVWPTQADGFGKSLSRKVATAYGNDPNNWQAANPTPGTANP